jgi:Arc/MetJ-type ribon-helix-helix transcriptional regulator
MAETKILSIPVPPAMDTLLQARITAQGFQTVSEYVRALIRADQQRAAREHLEAKLLEAVERGDYREATPEFWQRLREAAERVAPTTGEV